MRAAVIALANGQGGSKKTTDQRGVVHEYSFNLRRQLEWDRATTIPRTVYGGGSESDAVRSIYLNYDDLGQPTYVRSFSAATAAGTETALNAVSYEYEISTGTQTLLRTRQHHEGLSSTAPYPQYYRDLTYDGDNVLSGKARLIAFTLPRRSNSDVGRRPWTR